MFRKFLLGAWRNIRRRALSESCPRSCPTFHPYNLGLGDDLVQHLHQLDDKYQRPSLVLSTADKDHAKMQWVKKLGFHPRPQMVFATSSNHLATLNRPDVLLSSLWSICLLYEESSSFLLVLLVQCQELGFNMAQYSG